MKTTHYTTANLDQALLPEVWNSRKDVQHSHALIAIDYKKKYVAQGLLKDPTTLVDRRRGASEFSVKFGGRISYQSRAQGSTIVKDFWDYLNRKSPVRTGYYLHHHMIMVDGTLSSLVAAAKALDEGRMISFVNTAPYAMRLEFGKHKDGRPWSAKLPNGLYRIGEGYLKRKFKGFKIKLAFMPIAGLGVTAVKIKGRKRKATLLVYPVITIRRGN